MRLLGLLLSVSEIDASGRTQSDENIGSGLADRSPYDSIMAVATLRDSRGLSSLLFEVSDQGAWLTIRWVAQPFSSKDPLESDIRLGIDGGRAELAKLREDLRAHLHRPMSEIAESLFSNGYDLSSGNAFIGLEFTPPSEKQPTTTLAGRGLAIARYIASIDNLEIALPIDITVLDRFCSELGELVL
jgi:hypothetical protein